MPNWLRGSFRSAEQHSLDLIIARVGVALLLGFVVAGIYRVILKRRQDDAAGFTTTLVLLSPLIAIVTLVVGDSVEQAFALVGALSIVRFRTVVEDTRDTAFVIFAVAVGMACGAGYWVVAAVGIPVIALGALVMRQGDAIGAPARPPATLVVRFGLGHDPDVLLAGVFGNHLSESNLVAAATARQGAALELTYAVRLKRADATVALIADLNRVEGVQAVEFKQP